VAAIIIIPEAIKATTHHAATNQIIYVSDLFDYHNVFISVSRTSRRTHLVLSVPFRDFSLATQPLLGVESLLVIIYRYQVT
jgi:hypothetical protein